MANRIDEWKDQGFINFEEVGRYDYDKDKTIWTYYLSDDNDRAYKITIYEFEKNAKHSREWLIDKCKEWGNKNNRDFNPEHIGLPFDELFEKSSQNMSIFKNEYNKLLDKAQ